MLLFSSVGMCILQKLPNIKDSANIPMQSFVRGSREIFDAVVAQIENHFSKHANKVYADSVIAVWKKWGCDIVPASDNVVDYIKR